MAVCNNYFLAVFQKMSSSSKKHQDFVGEAMGDKPVDAVPGIGPVTAGNLKDDSNIDTAKKLYGEYVRNPDNFKSVIKEHGGDRGQQDQAYNAMKEWDKQHN